MKNINSPLYRMYCDHSNIISGPCWAKRINSLLDHLGCSDLRTNFDVGVNYHPMLKQRLFDQYIQEWYACINNLPKLYMYCKFKKTFELEKNTLLLLKNDLRRHNSCFRLSVRTLEIETGRYYGVTREIRICKCCTSGMIETESHFLLCCTMYKELRVKYLGNTPRPTLYMFECLM